MNYREGEAKPKGSKGPAEEVSFEPESEEVVSVVPSRRVGEGIGCRMAVQRCTAMAFPLSGRFPFSATMAPTESPAGKHLLNLTSK